MKYEGEYSSGSIFSFYYMNSQYEGEKIYYSPLINKYRGVYFPGNLFSIYYVNGAYEGEEIYHPHQNKNVFYV